MNYLTYKIHGMDKRGKLGIIGGMGSRAGAMLFAKVLDYSPALKDQDFMEVLLHSNSKIPDRTRHIVNDEESPVKELLRSIKLLNESKVDYIIMACLTAHYFYDTLQRHSKAKIIHLMKSTKEHIQTFYPRIQTIGLLATTGTLQSRIFHKEFENTGIELVTLDEEDNERIFMQSVYMEGGLKSATVSSEALSLFHQSIPKLMNQGAQAIIGGCTEVQIAIKKTTVEVPYIDPMDIAAIEAVKLCYKKDLQAVNL